MKICTTFFNVDSFLKLKPTARSLIVRMYSLFLASHACTSTTKAVS